MSDCKLFKLFLGVSIILFLRFLYILPWRRLLRKEKVLSKAQKSGKLLKTVIVLGSGTVVLYILFICLH
jgi:hypothetical protein